MLYQCEIGGVAPAEAIAAHREIEQPGRLTTPDAVEFATRLVVGTEESIAEIDRLIAGASEHWRPSRMAIVDRLILRLAVFEMLHVPDVPAAVVIDEAVEMARRFSGEQSTRFVNGLLDAIHKKVTEQNGRQ